MMRHPRGFTRDEMVQNQRIESGDDDDPTGATTLAIAGLPPSPSLPGLAFACCAASLPLLMSVDPLYCQSVMDLVLTALPFIFEPGPRDGPIRGVDRWRLQHLLNRMEQVPCFYDCTLGK